MENIIKPFWSKYFNFDWKFGIFLILLICIPRFLLVMNTDITENYSSISIIMLISALTPFVFLNKNGLKQIGLITPKNTFWLLLALLIGIAFSIFLYYIGNLIGGGTYHNWYVYIGKAYSSISQISNHERLIYFLIYSLSAMTFSPIGEELFFRGILHGAFSQSIGDKRASLVDGFTFAITHICHFGLVFVNNEWKFLLVPTLIWVIAMFILSILISITKKYSGSILGAIICHAGFNLGMGFSIFYLL